MKIFLKESVFEMAELRLDYLFSQFGEVAVWFSGGKDSTIVFQMALAAAERAGRLPLKVLWIDQEGEWQATVDYARLVMSDPRVEPMWFQMPMRLFNATSTTGEDEWLQCWAEGDEWMREKESLAITDNCYGTDRFGELFNAIASHEFPDKTAFVGGVRCEESPARTVGLTGKMRPVWHWITYGKKLNRAREQFTFYPIYDWSYTDVWKAIHDNEWQYNKLYDYQYQHGTNLNDMRCSNVHHETAIHALYYMQELEPETWANLCKRLDGINTAGIMQDDGFKISKVPPMFSGWKEYRDYLWDHLITSDDYRASFATLFAYGDKRYSINALLYERYCKRCVTALLRNDYSGIGLANFDGMNESQYVRWRKGKPMKSPEAFFRLNPFYRYDVKMGNVEDVVEEEPAKSN